MFVEVVVRAVVGVRVRGRWSGRSGGQNDRYIGD